MLGLHRIVEPEQVAILANSGSGGAQREGQVTEMSHRRACESYCHGYCQREAQKNLNAETSCAGSTLLPSAWITLAGARNQARPKSGVNLPAHKLQAPTSLIDLSVYSEIPSAPAVKPSLP